MIRLLLNAGARVNEHGEHEYTALHECAVSNTVDCAEELLSFSPDVESRDRDKRTPLILASLYGHREMCILLLNHGASVGATDRFGRSFLHYAARFGLQSVFGMIFPSPLLSFSLHKLLMGLYYCLKNLHISIVVDVFSLGFSIPEKACMICCHA